MDPRGLSLKIKATVQLSLVAGLMCAVTAHANEDLSPVQIFDLPKWIQVRDGAKESPQVMGLKKLIEIVYDRLTNRPWEDAAYWAEADKRWQEFRGSHCPSALTLCSLPATIDNVGHLEGIRNELVKPKTREVLNAGLAASGLKLSPNLIFPVQMPVADSEKNNFSFRIATVEAEEHSNIEGRMLTRMGDVVMYDIFTHRMNYTQDIARTYFAVDSTGNGYVQADRVREAAYTLAAQWKKVSQREMEYSAINATELLLQKLKTELEPTFTATYERLLSRMDRSNLEHAQHIHRFEHERSRGRYPTEVFQWVIYEQLLGVAEVLTEYYQDAKVAHQDLHTASTSLQAITHLQTQTHPRLLFYLLQREWDLDEGAVIEQVVNKPLAGMYMTEHLNVLLERGPYENSGMFASLVSAIDFGLLVAEPEFLKTHHPAFHARMSSLGMLDGEKLKSVPRDIQKAWLEEYLTKDGAPFVMGAYRVSAALSLGMNARQSRAVAESIRRARLAGPST